MNGFPQLRQCPYHSNNPQPWWCRPCLASRADVLGLKPSTVELMWAYRQHRNYLRHRRQISRCVDRWRWPWQAAALMAILCLSGQAWAECQWTGVVVHHSATPSGDVEAFRRHHVGVRGWLDVGYHFVILRDGTIQEGRPISMDGAHARGRNRTHIGVCLVGEADFTPAQVAALGSLLTRLCGTYRIGRVERHHDRCPGPGLDLDAIIDGLRRKEIAGIGRLGAA